MPPEEDPDLPPGKASVEIINNHFGVVWLSTISPPEGKVWGENWMAEGEVLYLGSSVTFYIEDKFLFDGVA